MDYIPNIFDGFNIVNDGFTPADLPSLQAWYRLNTGITVTGAGVSTWADQSGNGNDLDQGTDTNRPSKESDGSILFDGVDNYLKAAAFTLNQPTTVYILFKSVAWGSGDRIFDGDAQNSGAFYQSNVTPDVSLYAGGAVGPDSSMSVGSYSAVASVFNGSSSLIHVDSETPTTGDVGAANMAGFTLGTDGGEVFSWGNVQVKEVAIYSVAHDAATRAKIISYMGDV